MTLSTLVKLFTIASAVALLALATGYSKDAASAAQPPASTAVPTKPPVPKVTPTRIFGGAWTDEFWSTSDLSATNSVGVSGSRLTLKVIESLIWEQTWTGHFALGEFFQTRAISDSVQLAPIEGTGQYFTTGTYTSTVFDAGRSVDWLSANWSTVNYGVSSIQLASRTGDTFPPDTNWTDWIPFTGSLCGCSVPQEQISCLCRSDLNRIETSRYLQYRATFNNSDPNTAPAFTAISIAYGLHALGGSADSKSIAPRDLQSWKQVFYTGTIPVNTALTVDVLAPDGTVLLPNALSGGSLAGIDPTGRPSLQLRATFATTDPAYTPELDAWSLTWLPGYKLHFPVISR